MFTSGLKSSLKDDWTTPKYLFDCWNQKWHFTLDPCADDHNHLCDHYFTKENSGLLNSWENERVFMNPPYGKEIKYWVEKAKFEHKYHNAFIVALLPARTDTKWFHKYVYHDCSKIIFLEGRIKFSNNKIPAPFPSMLCIYGDNYE